jgi:aminoglycoside phosphotransferase family enzyme
MRSAGQSSSTSGNVPAVSVDDKVGFLSAPESYPQHTGYVTLLQTHHAWVFMTDRHVYKMKKPFRAGGRDYSSLESRHVLCLDEYRLNRRLAARTYLGVIPLVLTNTGGLALNEDGTVVEWLVKMRRLPETRVLPALAAAGRINDSDITRLMRKLSRFHQQALVCRFAKGAYAARLRHHLEFWCGELERCGLPLPKELVGELSAAQLQYINARSELLERRSLEGRVRNVHGDLRPEHIFILENAKPEIIDCLEFDADLSRLDCAAELAYFAMETRHAGLEWLGEACIDAYRREQAETVGPAHLMAFYAALAATARAGLMAWRALEVPSAHEWGRRATAYLYDAQYYLARAV